MQKLTDKLMLSCKKASELVDKKSVTGLSIKENIMLRMHTAMCDICKAYQKQSKILDRLLMKHLQKTNETNFPKIINNELKQKILARLK